MTPPGFIRVRDFLINLAHVERIRLHDSAPQQNGERRECVTIDGKDWANPFFGDDATEIRRQLAPESTVASDAGFTEIGKSLSVVGVSPDA